jgi:2-succinyl-5-enolpyruvyl-6-hydroxy-3-cyclohexene-1-carboxylate synthase
MLVVTADRPPELRDVGAAQTIDQTGLYGRSVRWFHDPGIADPAAVGSWRSLARRCFEAAATGPVHLNLPFREPFLGAAGELPTRTSLPVVTSTTAVVASDELAALLVAERGLILAGGRSGVVPDEVAMLSTATGWPVLADPTSGCRHLPGTICAFDAMVRVEEFADAHRPEVVVRIGQPAASRALATWIAGSDATVVQVGGPGVIDPEHRVAVSLPASALVTLAALAASPAVSSGHRPDPGSSGHRPDPGSSGHRPDPGPSEWARRWSEHGALAELAIAAVLADEATLSEPGIARATAEHLPEGARLVVASSMPVRDLEWFGGPAAIAHANRGANGIDGVVSTAMGIALGGTTTVALVGDIAFLHDSGALTALRHRDADLRIVVVDNDGGGIFSFLPQASALPHGRFEELFGTPHGSDLLAVAAAHGIDGATVDSAAALARRLATTGPSVTRAVTDREDNVRIHDKLNRAVAGALRDG